MPGEGSRPMEARGVLGAMMHSLYIVIDDLIMQLICSLKSCVEFIRDCFGSRNTQLDFTGKMAEFYRENVLLFLLNTTV